MDDKIRDAKGRFITGHKRLCPLNDHGRFISYNSLEYVGMIFKKILLDVENKDYDIKTGYDEGLIRGYKKGLELAIKLIEKYAEK